MKLYSIIYEDAEGAGDDMIIAHDGYLDTADAYNLAVAQAIEVWGNDEPDSYTTEDIYNLSCAEIREVATADGSRRFTIKLEEVK